ncbi:hypothetical protein Nepgr_015371 [Nepenthes gracilis]|uniref:BZIP domain-containing protein n=1 Tax=Nepenthes gracilis TaxID=150966 RepID=A0AAD3XRG0_NEPGR|nr:hypothetical protein Nepgr_015371 [Nepenthes gracilis]
MPTHVIHLVLIFLTHTPAFTCTPKLCLPREDKCGNKDDSAESMDKKTKKPPLGNRAAVHKYCKKKKARAVSLEDEVIKL